MQRLIVLLGGLALLLGGGQARAGIILDNSPTATGGNGNDGFFNQVDNQIFAARVEFANAATVTGIDIFGYSAITAANYFPAPVPAAPGDSATVQFWQDLNGLPDLTNPVTAPIANSVSVQPFADSATESDLLHVDFAQVTLAPNTVYWVSMAGTSQDLGLLILVGGGMVSDSGQLAFVDGTPDQLNNPFASTGGHMAFRLEGSFGPQFVVPEPSSIALLGTACVALVGYSTWRRRKQAAMA